MMAIVQRRRLILTGLEFLAFFSIGLVLAMVGPMLLDLAHQTNSSIAEIGRLLNEY